MKRAALWPPSHNITSKKKRLPLLLALPSRRGLERLAAVEVGRLAGLPSTLLTAGLDVVRLLARLALVERGVELRQDVPWRVRDVAEHQQLALDRPDDVEDQGAVGEIGVHEDVLRRGTPEEGHLSLQGTAVRLDRSAARDALRTCGLRLSRRLVLNLAQLADRDVPGQELDVRVNRERRRLR